MDPQLALIALVLVAVVEVAKRLKLLPARGTQYVAGAIGAIGNVLIAAAAMLASPPPDVFAQLVAQLAAGAGAGLVSNGVYDWLRPLIEALRRPSSPPPPAS